MNMAEGMPLIQFVIALVVVVIIAVIVSSLNAFGLRIGR
jgi:hypothetical protein